VSASGTFNWCTTHCGTWIFLRAYSLRHHHRWKTRQAVALAVQAGISLRFFDRVTGKPIWPIPERPVEVGDVPGEWYITTQPIPSKPLATAAMASPSNDLIDFTPALRERGKRIASKISPRPVYTSDREQTGRSLARSPWGRPPGYELARGILRPGNTHRLPVCMQRVPRAHRTCSSAERISDLNYIGGNGRKRS